MNTIKLNCRNKPKMVAHRGISALEKENTHAAFIAAGNRSYCGIETDVHFTADGQYVCIHDATTKRVGIDDINVELCTYDTVRNLQLCQINGKKGRNDICIPSFREYIQICKQYEKIAVPELKSAFSKEQIAELCQIIREEEWEENTVFIAFGLQNLIYLRELYPNQKAQYLIGVGYFEKGGTNEDLTKTLQEYNLDLDIYYKSLTKELSDMVHAAGKEINVWTVDTVEDGCYVAEELRVDYITSNILE